LRRISPTGFHSSRIGLPAGKLVITQKTALNEIFMQPAPQR
jgi:hypothetical protein